MAASTNYERLVWQGSFHIAFSSPPCKRCHEMITHKHVAFQGTKHKYTCPNLQWNKDYIQVECNYCDWKQEHSC